MLVVKPMDTWIVLDICVNLEDDKINKNTGESEQMIKMVIILSFVCFAFFLTGRCRWRYSPHCFFTFRTVW